MGTVSISRLRDHVIQNYGPSTSKYKNSTQDAQSLVDFAIFFLDRNVNPKEAMTQEAIQQFNKFFKFNFANYDCSDSVSPETVQPLVEDFSPENPPPNAICKFYSFAKNLSDTYEFANPADIHSCSSKDVSSIHCTMFFDQKICRFFQPDHSLFMTHKFEQGDETFIYSTYKTRTSQANLVISTYDFNSNLISQLTYPAFDLPENFEENIKIELSSIVADIHSQAFLNAPSLSHASTLDDTTSVDLSKSYMMSLIS